MGLPNASSASNWVDDVRMRDVGDWRFVLVTACTVLSVLLLVHALYVRLWKPYTRRRFYEKQGIKGPVFRLFVGNLPEIRALNASVPDVSGISEPAVRRVGLELFVFTEKYGKVSVYEHGSTTRLIFSDPKLAKEVLVAKAGHYHKTALTGEVLNRVTGEGSIVVTEEEQWKEQNHSMSPAFRHNFLTDQFHYILESANELVTKWQTMINNSDEKYGAEVAIDLDLPETLLEIIIKTTFGSTIVEGGGIRAIHKALNFMLRTLGPRLSGYGRLFPGYGFLPTPTNIKVWIESRNVEKVLMNFVCARLKQVREMKRKNPKATRQSIYETNLLGMMLEAYEEGNSNMTKSQLFDQCKTMLFDVRTVLMDDSLFTKAAEEAFPEYNVKHMIPVKLLDHSGKVLVTKYAEVDNSHYLDPRIAVVATIDHIKQVNAHYFEEGNVQLDTSYECHDSIQFQDARDMGAGIVNVVECLEFEYLNSLEVKTLDHLFCNFGPHLLFMF